METCKAIIQEGPRKGNRCKFPAGENLYCGRHERNRIYDEGITNGIKWCRFFFRGCNAQLTDSNKNQSCIACRERLCKKVIQCKHEGCKFKIVEGKYCKKHERDNYRDEEKENNIKFCDINRGCFTIVKEKTCDDCLKNSRTKDNDRYNKKKELIIAEKAVGSSKRTCIGCSKEFTPFDTHHNKDSMSCKGCLEKQNVADSKRCKERDYKNEHCKNLEGYYKTYITDTLRRGHGDFQINFEEFEKLVKSPCYYCKEISQINGIDRINNELGYTNDNCVAACWMCNRMKHFYHPEFFLNKCKIISKEITPTKEFYKKWSLYYTRSNYKNYTTYKRETEEHRKLEFEISQQQWDWITRSPCYLCGYQDAHGIGLDRVDNTIRKYTFDNCRPCCGSCNNMKNELSFTQVIEHAKLISQTWPISPFDTVPVFRNPLKDAEDKGHYTNIPDRKHWKAEGLYYAILSKNSDNFFESNKGVLTQKEFKELCEEIIICQKDMAIIKLKKVLMKLKKRKLRKIQPTSTLPTEP